MASNDCNCGRDCAAVDRANEALGEKVTLLQRHLGAIYDALADVGVINREEVEASADEIVPAIREWAAAR